jgi:RimJ/RimL family protein N-acetyltransferase
MRAMPDRIRLRLPEPDDHPLLAAWCNDPDLTPHFYADEPVSLESHLRWYEGVKNDPNQRFFVIEALVEPPTASEYGTPYQYIPGLKPPAPIGTTGLLNMDWRSRSAEYGRFKIGDRRYRGNGCGFEAEMLLMRHAFEHLNLNRVYGYVLAYNERVRALHRKTGFVEEGCLRQAVYKRGQYHDLVVVGLLRKDWERLNAKAQGSEGAKEEVDYAHDGAANR